MKTDSATQLWRSATPNDDEAIISMCAALNAEDPGPDPVPRAHIERTLRVLREQPSRGRAIVFVRGELVLGYALLIAYWSNELGGEICTIDELYVTQGERGKGAATALINALAAGSESLWGAKPALLGLEVTPSNARARQLYERLGFQKRKNAMMVRRT